MITIMILLFIVCYVTMENSDLNSLEKCVIALCRVVYKKYVVIFFGKLTNLSQVYISIYQVEGLMRRPWSPTAEVTCVTVKVLKVSAAAFCVVL